MEIALQTSLHLICQRHGEPFRDNWPLGVEKFADDGMKELLRVESFKRAYKGIQSRIEVKLRRRQMCCWLPRSVLLNLYETCGIGEVAGCCNCGGDRIGMPYLIPMNKQIVACSHVCFDCIIHSMPKAER